MSVEGYITVMDVKNHALCPRITYLTHVLHLKERVTEAMEYGREVHSGAPIAPIIPRLKPARVLRNVELRDDELRLSGRVDTLVITRTNEYVPVEVKWSDPDPSGGAQRHHKVQMAAYALLINKNYNTTVKRAVIYYMRANRVVEVPITQRDIKHVQGLITQIRRIISDEREPSVRESPAKCINCGYISYCQAKRPRA